MKNGSKLAEFVISSHCFNLKEGEGSQDVDPEGLFPRHLGKIKCKKLLTKVASESEKIHSDVRNNEGVMNIREIIEETSISSETRHKQKSVKDA